MTMWAPPCHLTAFHITHVATKCQAETRSLKPTMIRNRCMCLMSGLESYICRTSEGRQIHMPVDNRTPTLQEAKQNSGEHAMKLHILVLQVQMPAAEVNDRMHR